MGRCPSQNTQNHCQGDAVVPGEGGQGHHAAHNAPPVATMMNGSLPSHIAPVLHFVWEPI